MNRPLPLTDIGSSACTAVELYHYRCKIPWGFGDKAPMNLHSKFDIMNMRQRFRVFNAAQVNQ